MIARAPAPHVAGGRLHGSLCWARGPGARESFAGHLRRLNDEADLAARISRSIPYAQYLRAVNDQDDLARRVHGNRVAGCFPGAGEAGVRDERGKGSEPAEAVAKASLPHLGDVTVSREVAVLEVIRVAYGVRNLLSRGAVIDLTG